MKRLLLPLFVLLAGGFALSGCDDGDEDDDKDDKESKIRIEQEAPASSA